METLVEHVHRLHKAELHVHLEGTGDAAALRGMLAARNAAVPDDLDTLFVHDGFREFLDHFRGILDVMGHAEDYGWLAGRYLDSAAAQGVRHVEFYLSLGAAVRRGLPARSLLESIGDAVDRRRESITASVLVDCVRQFGVQEAAATLDAALEHADLHLISGFGMGGDEHSQPAKEFAPVFARARERGLHTVVHAGEVGGPLEVEQVLRHLRPHRIAHGIGAAQSPALLARLAEEKITLDVCLTSNLRTGAVARLGEHPLPQLLRAGVSVSLGTDDPGMFGTDLTREYLLVVEELGLTTRVLQTLADNSLKAAFPLP